MGQAAPVIRDIRARAVDVPIQRPVRTAMGSVDSAPLVVIDVRAEDGCEGRSYIFAYTVVALLPLRRLV